MHESLQLVRVYLASIADALDGVQNQPLHSAVESINRLATSVAVAATAVSDCQTGQYSLVKQRLLAYPVAEE